MPQFRNPNIKIDYRDEEDLIHLYLERAEKIYTTRTIWFMDQLKYQNMRRGVLDPKDFPFEGCANIHIPITERFVRSMKAAFMEVLSIEPPVLIDPTDENTDPQIAQKWERYLTFLYKNKMRVKVPQEKLVDGMLEKGENFLKVGYEKEYGWREIVVDLDRFSEFDEALMQALGEQSVRLEEWLAIKYKMDLELPDDRREIARGVAAFKAGKRTFSMQVKTVEKDQPVWIPVLGRDLLRMPNAPDDIAKHRFFIHRFWQTIGEIRGKVRSGYYGKSALEDIKNIHASRVRFNKGSESFAEDSETLREGMVSAGDVTERFTEDMEVETYEVNTYWTPDPENEPERKAIFTFFPVYHRGRFARKVWLDRPRWPFKEFNFDNPEGLTYSARGVAKFLEHIQLEVNAQHNNKLDNMTWKNAGTFRYDPGLLVMENPESFKMVPGEGVPAQQGGIEFLQVPSETISYEREEQILTGHAETLLGQLQSVLGRSGQIGTNRTATEIGAVEALSGRIGNMDVEKFQEAMSDVHLMTIYEIAANMPDEVYFRYTGINGETLFDEVSREEIDKISFDIRPHGTLANSNRVIEAQKWLNRFTILSQLAQSGIPVDLREVARMWLAADGIRNLDRIMPPPQQQPGAVPAGPQGGSPNAPSKAAAIPFLGAGGGGASGGGAIQGVTGFPLARVAS